MNIELLITDINFVISLAVSLGLGLLVFVRRPATGAAVNILFLCMSIAVSLWQAFYLYGINAPDAYLSRYSFVVAVLSSIFILIINTHLVLTMTGRWASRKKFMSIVYGIACGIALFHLIFPETLLLASRSFMYLPFFMVPGKFYYVQDTFFFFCLMYFLFECINAYWHGDFRLRNRIKYFFAGYAFGYSVGLFPALILYGISVDPIFASLTGFYVVPMAYAILRYDLIEVTILAKRAFSYAIGVVSLTMIILFIGYANDTIDVFIPGFPVWLLPLASAVLAVAMGVFVWKKIKEADTLKFQFVDVVTHKFRTPLTHIKWSTEIIKSSQDATERTQAITNIEQASLRLVEMTNSLIGMSRTDENQYAYNYASEQIPDMIKEVMSIVTNQANAKKIVIKTQVPEGLPPVYADHKRLEFVVQMMLENALVYSPEGGTVALSVHTEGSFVEISVKDSGIGISKEDLAHLFSRFYRAANALAVHTEGLGIGLSVSRDIMKRHGGDIWAESGGLGQGSTFTIKIPIQKK